MYAPTSFSDLVYSTKNMLMISCHCFFCWVGLVFVGGFSQNAYFTNDVTNLLKI